eukprot:5954615-Pyramimonas_sp.AAC.1
MIDFTVSVSSPTITLGSTRTYDVRKELTGKLNSQVIRWLSKVLRVDSTVSVSSPAVGFPVLIGPCRTLTMLGVVSCRGALHDAVAPPRKLPLSGDPGADPIVRVHLAAQ